MEWLKYFVAILSGLATAIPLVVKLVEYVKKAVKERNWSEIVKLTMSYMAMAEKKFTDGATRKKWVMSMVQTSAQCIEYNLDDAALVKISDMIDGICDVAKIINISSVGQNGPEEDKEAEKAGG